MRKIRILGIWYGAPKTDFPFDIIASRLKDLRDADLYVLDNAKILGVHFAEDNITYGYGIFYLEYNKELVSNSFLILLEDRGDWEAILHTAEEYAQKINKSKEEALVTIVKKLSEAGTGDIDLDSLT